MKVTAFQPFKQEYFAIEFSTEKIQSIQLCAPEPTDVLLTPGFCDIQNNGAFGVDLVAPALTVADIHRLNHRLLQEGITAWCPTIITSSPDLIRRNLGILRKACEESELTTACIIGFHLEGPYISPEEGACGAHDAVYIHPPDWEEFQSFQKAAGGRIRIVTVAPEVEGAISFIHKLEENGIVPALGHTLADEETINRAVEAGAKLATHLGNGLPEMLNRHHNPLLSMLMEDDLYASVIFDGHHLPPKVRALLRRVKGVKRLIMISDSTYLTGMPAGVYEEMIGGKVELSENGRLSLYGTPYLAGSAQTLRQDAAVALADPEKSLTDVMQMSMINPRSLLNINTNSVVLIKLYPSNQQFEILLTAIDNRIQYQNSIS
ncbi:MAG: hypothetical protein J7K85_00270 [Anaerolineaceae bacterium]|nr:hypothetical protein [Anaerolineaceae bacterium]